MSLLLGMRFKVLLHNSKKLVNHHGVIFSTFFDISLSITLLKMCQFGGCGDSVAFRKFQIKLAQSATTIERKVWCSAYILYEVF